MSDQITGSKNNKMPIKTINPLIFVDTTKCLFLLLRFMSQFSTIFPKKIMVIIWLFVYLIKKKVLAFLFDDIDYIINGKELKNGTVRIKAYILCILIAHKEKSFVLKTAQCNVRLHTSTLLVFVLFYFM